MTKHFCDICKKEVATRADLDEVKIPTSNTKNYLTYHKFNACISCREDILLFIETLENNYILKCNVIERKFNKENSDE